MIKKTREGLEKKTKKKMIGMVKLVKLKKEAKKEEYRI